MSEELKPCPFCGGEAMKVNITREMPIGLRKSGFLIYCDNCFAEVFNQNHDLAIERWNRRIDNDGQRKSR